ncbi:hypothetical protein ACFSC1_13900 [Paracoccus aurantiacus]|uniref:hypothetical protein n=1 Tax=Paracoccus aurantiacus TaxID=2599412 RepID=UPI003631E4F7
MNTHVSRIKIGVTPVTAAGCPFSLSCAGEALAHDPDLGVWPVQTSILLGRFRAVGEVMACALRRGQQGGIRADLLPGFTPNFLILMDGQQRLCLAGRITLARLVWCNPVASDAEARHVVQQACQLRAQAMVALDRDAPAEAQALRFRAAALDGRLVDPLWRETAATLLRQPLAA